jgi:phosphoadenosine phosphosulfate reductase
MASVKTKQLDRINYPGVERIIKKSIQHLIDNNNYFSNYNATSDEVFDWWISNKGTAEYFENLRRQTKINF